MIPFALGWLAHALWRRWSAWERGVDLEPVWPRHRTRVTNGTAWTWTIDSQGEGDPPDPYPTSLADYPRRRWELEHPQHLAFQPLAGH